MKIKLDSRILNSDLKIQLTEMCELSHSPKWELLYRATRDGFTAKDFHQKCDNFKNTLIVIKSTSDNILGGFASMEWNSTSTVDSKFVHDPSAFIFSLVNKDNKPFKALPKSTTLNGIFCDASKGPAFGERTMNIGQSDLGIFSNSNINSPLNSYSYFGHGYTNSEEITGTDSAKTILAGAHKFGTVEMEVFHQKASGFSLNQYF